MTLETLLERFFSASLLIVCVSHAVQPKLWRDFFLKIRGTGVGGLIIAMYTLPQGLAIALGHNIWTWDLRVITTIAGWGMTTKSVLYAFWPARADAVIPDGENAHKKYAWAGFIGAPVALLLVWDAFFRHR